MPTNNTTRITLEWREKNDDVFLRQAFQQRDLDVRFEGKTEPGSYRWEKTRLLRGGRDVSHFRLWPYGSDQLSGSPLDDVDIFKLADLFGGNCPQWIVQQYKDYDRQELQSNQGGVEMSLKPDHKGSVVRSINSCITDVAQEKGVPSSAVYSKLDTTLSDWYEELKDLITKAYTSAEAPSTATNLQSRYPLRGRMPPSEDTPMSGVSDSYIA